MGELGDDDRRDVLRAPEPLDPTHNCVGFRSGEAALDTWLRQRALKNQLTGATRSYVTCHHDRVVGYYSLVVGSASRRVASGTVGRNMPDPIPGMLLARLAVGIEWQERGLGASLLRDVVARTVQAAEIAGIRAMLVHALSEDAKRFYGHFGFQPAQSQPLTLMATLPGLTRAMR